MKCIVRFVVICFIAASAFVEAAAIAPFTIGDRPIVNPQVVAVTQGNPKTALLNGMEDGIQGHLRKMGIQSSQFSEIVFKEQNEFKYGLYGQIIFGDYFLQNYARQGLNLPRVQKSSPIGTYEQYTAKAAAIFLAYYVHTHPSQYTFVKAAPALQGYIEVPLRDAFTYDKARNEYSATVRARFYKESVVYEEYVHVLAYEDPYNGAAVRFLAFASYDDDKLWSANRDILQP